MLWIQYGMSSVISCQNLKRIFHDGSKERRVLNDVTLSVNEGEIVGISGNSGSGKTTLLNLLGLLDEPSEGKVFYGSQEVAGLGYARKSWIRNTNVGFVFQEFFLIKEFNVLENIMIPGLTGGFFWQWWGRKKKVKERAVSLLAEVGLAGREQSNVRKLSGGEKQRVAIARALINEPSIVFCDEPTGNLDEDTELEIKDLFEKINAHLKTTFIIVSHNNSLLEICTRRYHLTHGHLEEVSRGKGQEAGE